MPPPSLTITTPAAPPNWAVLERYVLEHLHPAAVEFVERYTRPDGTLVWRDEWPGMDGSDDGYESFQSFPLYYLLGGPAEMLDLARKLWDAVTRQFTAYGQVHDEFDAYYDWMHHGESYTYFYLLGLADPADETHRRRAERVAGLYLGENADAPNYDPQRRMIRSPITGSRGPRFVNTAEDWVTHRPVLADYPLPYDDIPGVTTSDAWIDDARFPAILEAMNRRMMRGDVPLNLTATSLVAHAFMLTGDEKYHRWIVEYVDAWIERTRANGGVLPDNVGPGGRIGECMDGKWWGGYYGWRWPHGLLNQIESTLIGGANAYLVTGEDRFLELPRAVVDLMRREAKVDERGRVVVPHRHKDSGWYDYRPIDPAHLVYLWHVSQSPEDYRRMGELAEVSAWDTLAYAKGKGDWEHAGPWLGFIEGRNADYPAAILRAAYAETLRRLERIRSDRTTPDERDVHHWQQRNPVVLEGLVQLMLGGPNHVYHGGLLHTRLFYFDAAAGRPGLPPDVAVLVSRADAGGVLLEAVNLHPGQSRELLVQAGSFGEHRFTTARLGHETTEVGGRHLHVHLAPGAFGRIELGMERFVNRPTIP